MVEEKWLLQRISNAENRVKNYQDKLNNAESESMKRLYKNRLEHAQKELETFTMIRDKYYQKTKST